MFYAAKDETETTATFLGLNFQAQMALKKHRMDFVGDHEGKREEGLKFLP